MSKACLDQVMGQLALSGGGTASLGTTRDASRKPRRMDTAGDSGNSNDELVHVMAQEAEDAVAATARLKDGWNGYGAECPSMGTRLTMYDLIGLVASQGMAPERIVPSAEGGLFALFKGRMRDGTPLKADVEVFNTGEMTFAYRPKGGELTVWEVDPEDSVAVAEGVERIRALFA